MTIFNLQILRGLAALGVVFYHTGFPLPGDLWAWWVREWYGEDAIDTPDKMRKLDFGTWQGKKRPVLIFSINEDHMVDMFQQLTFETLPHTRPRTWDNP
jgi:hypothetical protein